MTRRARHEEHENHERWLISYADFITLLFAFFVVMYSVSSINEGKYRVLSESLVAAFRSPAKSIQPIQVGAPAKSPLDATVSLMQAPVAVPLPPLPTPQLNDTKPNNTRSPGEAGAQELSAEQLSEQDRTLGAVASEIERTMQSLIEDGLIKIRRTERAVEVEINANMLFANGSATLSDPARTVVLHLAQVLKRFPNPILVEGFTDDVPISSPIFPSNWELSAGRAANVVRVLAEEGVSPAQMAAIGYGQYRPIADNATEAGRAKNRRVVLVVRAAPETLAAAR